MKVGAEAVWTRLELATSCVTGRHSNQLNYQTKVFSLNKTHDSFVVLNSRPSRLGVTGILLRPP